MSVNRPIPALYQGVSQQPAAQRALEQCEALDNGYVTAADGVRKRPPTQHVKLLQDITPIDAKVHHYFRGDGEHNVIMIARDGVTNAPLVKAYNGVTGAAKTVDTTTHAAVLDYIGTSVNAVDNIGCLTVADTTFIWNRTKVVATKAATIPAQVPRLFVFIKEGAPDTTYTIDLPGFGYADIATSTATSTFSTQNIATALKAEIDGWALPLTVWINNNLLTIYRNDGLDFTFNVFDSRGSTLMYAFKNRVERYSDLPRYFLEDHIIEVRGQGDAGGKGSFWVTFKRNTTKEAGHWEETVAPIVGQVTEFDPTTLPLALVREASGNFTLKRIEWDVRRVGSTAEGSAPVPSFVGGKINSLYFYRGRLGFLSGENIILSRANSLYNFWPKSTAQVDDDDPIDVTANGTKVSILRHAAPFQRTLMLFSDNTQFPLTGGEILSPKNVRADPATEFDCSPYVAPVSSGQDLFFVFERASDGATFSGVREYTVNQSSVTNDAVDVTAHVPQYVPRQVHYAAVSSTEDLLLLLSKVDHNAVYFYKYLWSGDKKVQSAWGRWEFRPSDKVLSAAMDKTTVHFVIQRIDGLHLEKMNLQSTATTGALPFQIMLDSLAVNSTVPFPAGYDAFNNETLLFQPYVLPPNEGEWQIVAGPGFANAGALLPIVRTSFGGAAHHVKGDWRAFPCYFGIKYAHRFTLSEQFVRDQESNAVLSGRLQLKHMTVAFKNAAVFRAEVATPGRDLATYKYSALKIGIAGSIIGGIVLRDGTFRFPVASKSDRATITLVNDSPYPCTWYAGEWDGEFTMRSKR